jgi:hypothetical protein
MSTLSTPTPRIPRVLARPLAAAALLLALAGCTDTGLAPETQAPESAALKRDKDVGAAAQPGSTRRGKYRDSSAPHATGRSGSATLAARALLGSDGVTYLTITTGDLEKLDAAPGELAKVQVKAFTPDGEKLYTLNFQRPSAGGSVVLRLDGLSRGSRVQVQANVRGIDRNRTDVVTLTETVKRAPSLQTRISVPDRVAVGVPTVVTGVVSETGGEAGAWVACELWVNGSKVDQAESVWVDAGDAVTCAFTHTFDRVGEQDVEVRVSGDGAGAGAPPSITTSSALVDAVSPSETGFEARAEEKTVRTARLIEYHWEKPDGSFKQYRDEAAEGQRTQSLTVNGTLTRAAVFPLARVELQMEGLGTVYQNDVFSIAAGAPDLSGRVCASQPLPLEGTVFTLCTAGGSTTFSYNRFGGSVTYFSEGFSRTWDGPSGTWTQNVLWNDPIVGAHPYGGQIRGWGSEVTVRIRVTDAVGTFGVTPVVPLTGFDNVLSATPRTCTTESLYWLEGGQLETCTSGEVREFGKRGEARG